MGMKASNAIATFFKYFVLILVGLIMIYPLLWMISATFKDNSEIFAGIGLWIKNPTLEGYKNALNNFGGSINILQAMLNTYSYVLPKVICTVVSSCIAAYGFGRFDFPGRKILFSIMLATLFLPQVVLNVPQFLLYTKFGWVNSPFYLAIWVHCAFATETYFVYQLVQFMRNVPRDLDEAAAIDGCGIYGCFFRIALPLCRTGFFVSGLMTFINNWNELLLAMVFISDPMKKTLPVTLTYFVGPYATNYVQMFAAIIIAIAPTVVVYSLFSNQIVEGLATGAVKG